MFGERQLALYTTLVSSLHCDGSLQPGAANRDGAVLDAARRRKNRTYPELIGRRGCAQLVVLAGDVDGRWSEETRPAKAFAASLFQFRGGFGADGLTPLTHEVENTFSFAGLE